MMFPMHQVLVMSEFTHVVGFLNWKNGISIITGVQMSYGPTDNSYLSLKQLSVIFVIKIVFLQQILFCIKNVYIYVSHCLLVLFVILPILLILVYECTLLNLMEVQKQQFLLFNLEFKKLYCYFITLWCSFLYCQQFVISVSILSKCLTIVKVIFLILILWVLINLTFKNIITCLFYVYSNRDYTCLYE